MTTDLPTARKALGQLISTVEGDTRYYPKAKTSSPISRSYLMPSTQTPSPSQRRLFRQVNDFG